MSVQTFTFWIDRVHVKTLRLLPCFLFFIHPTFTVSFDNKRIDISFNDILDKEFVKNLSAKLFEWTEQRWIIAFTQNKGELSKKQVKKLSKLKLIDKTKKSEIHRRALELHRVSL